MNVAVQASPQTRWHSVPLYSLWSPLCFACPPPTLFSSLGNSHYLYTFTLPDALEFLWHHCSSMEVGFFFPVYAWYSELCLAKRTCAVYVNWIMYEDTNRFMTSVALPSDRHGGDFLLRGPLLTTITPVSLCMHEFPLALQPTHMHTKRSC